MKHILHLFCIFPSLFLGTFIGVLDAHAATQGRAVYGKIGSVNPFEKPWNGSTFGNESAANESSAFRWIDVQNAPRIRTEKLMGTVGGAVNTLHLQRWNGSSWSSEWNRSLAVTANRAFSIAYETYTGNALVVYGDNSTQLKYRLWDGVSWTNEQNAGSPLDSIPQFVQAVGRPATSTATNDIFVIATTSGGKLHALRWTNGSWGDQLEMTTDPAQVTTNVAGIAYEQTSKNAYVVWGTSAAEVRFRSFTDAWQAEQIAYSGLGANPDWLSLASDTLSNSNNFSLIWNDASSTIQFGIWNGSAWQTRPSPVNTNALDRRNIDTGWERNTGKAVFVFAQASPDSDQLSSRTWTASGGYSAVTLASGELAQDMRWIQLIPDRKSNQLMALALTANNEFAARVWNGSTWSGFESVSTNGLSSDTETVDFAWDDTESNYDQSSFRWYADNDSLTPTDPWPSGSVDTGENTALTASALPPMSQDVIRLRLGVNVTLNGLVAEESSFSLQFAKRLTTCAALTESDWSAVGNIDSAAIWRGWNASPSDGTTLTTLRLSGADRTGTYEEQNNSAVNPSQVDVGELVEYDWILQNNNAPRETPYCFRMGETDGNVFDTYTIYPELTTAGYRAASKNWRWFDDETHETPTSSLALENITATNTAYLNTIKLRLTLFDLVGAAATNTKFNLQYSTSSNFAESIHTVVSINNCEATSLWCYGNGGDTDDDPLTTIVLTDAIEKGTHNETSTSTSTFDPAANSATEFEFTLKHMGARTNTTYYFRAYNVTDDVPVSTSTDKTYPSLTTEGPTLSFSVSGLASGETIDGTLLTIASTSSTLPFGTIAPNTSFYGAQRLTVSTNATDGYRVLIKSNNPSFLSVTSDAIDPIEGTNGTPVSWQLPVSIATGISSAFGYHATDDTLSGAIPERFAAEDTWSKIENTAFGMEEIAYIPNPVSGQETDILFRIEASGIQPEGNYTLNGLEYLIQPLY